ncbi:hypothetical protein GQ55_5G511200 [Panicum hallii var. hallii]|uniref:Uncharacterized protein n=1 Tax=Panicum hallii var. hallii TaxID=1504633 RepID=A0A2T7DSB3_9POAL|nr:hypothetical protein GQ55_5G511200 [Panicum hallii var. hallii]PUZ58466.1 hypothetical protein GQ55_5G511200 [Panicum hallii var. hallii]
MAKGGGGSGVSPAPPRGQVYLSEWRRLYDRLLKMLREEHALAEELSIERAHLAAELEFQRIGRREREEIFQARIQQIWRDEERRKRVEKAERAVLIGGKDLESRCYQKLVELGDSDAEDFRSFIAALTAENSELKAKLKEFESQAQLNENSVDHQQSGKDLRLELRKLKQAYKNLSSEKDKQISALNAEKDFVWNQFKTMEQDYIVTIKSKNIEAKQAIEAAQKLQKNVDELQVAAQKKDDEIDRLQAEVTTAKEKMLLLEDELKQMHSLVKGKDVETGKNKDHQSETSRKSKKDNNKTNRKSKSEGPVSKEKLRTSQVTPDRIEVKTSRTRAAETSQKRKRGSSLSCGSRRCSTRPLQVKAAVSPMLLPPSFTVPRLKTPTPP